MNFKRFEIFLLFMPGVFILLYFILNHFKGFSSLQISIISVVCALVGFLTSTFLASDSCKEVVDNEPDLVNALLVKRAAGTATIIDAWVVNDGHIEYVEGGLFIKISYPKASHKPSVTIDASDTFVVAFDNKIEIPVYEYVIDEIHRKSDVNMHDEILIHKYFQE